MKILLTHTPHMRENYYGARALAGLSSLGEVVLHQRSETLEGERLIEAARGCELIVADRATAVPAPVFAALPLLRSVSRCAVDIRNIDVEAASSHGVLVTRARPGFVESVTELVLGLLVDLNRGISRAAAIYHTGRVPTARMGRQLSGTTIGIIGYGAIGRAVAPLAAHLGMRVLVPTFRSSCITSAPTFHELRKAMGTSKSMILVPLFYLKFLDRIRRLWCRNFK